MSTLYCLLGLKNVTHTKLKKKKDSVLASEPEYYPKYLKRFTRPK